MISAQFSEEMSKALKVKGEDPIGVCISSGQESLLLSWLRKRVHPHGRKLNAENLVHEVTGKPLSSIPFLRYLENKLESLRVVA